MCFNVPPLLTLQGGSCVAALLPCSYYSYIGCRYIYCLGVLLSWYVVLLLRRSHILWYLIFFKVNHRVLVNSQFRFKMSKQLVYLMLSKAFQ